MKKTIEKIKDFLDNNRLDFTSGGSSLNSSCTIISGFALFCGITDAEDLNLIVSTHLDEREIFFSSFGDEMKRVFEYAQNNNYGQFWETEQARLEYKF